MSAVTYQTPINYEHKVASAPYYTFNRILQNSGGSNVVLSATSSSTSQFDLPANVVYNLAQSYLTFDIRIGTPNAANNAQAILNKLIPFRRVFLQNRAGRVMADISNFQDFWMLTKNLITTVSEFMSYGPVAAGTTPQSAINDGFTVFNNPSFAGGIVAPAAALLNNAATISNTLDGGVGINAPAVDVANSANRLYLTTESQYMTGAVTQVAPNGTVYLRCRVPLHKIPFSFFSVNRDFLSTEVIQLNIEWEGYNNFCFSHAVLGSLTLPTTVIAAAADLPTISNFSLYLATEQNQGVIDSLRAKVLSGGLSMVLPYSTVFTQGINATGSANINYRVGPPHGETLLRVVSAEKSNIGTNGDSLTGRCLYYNIPDPATGITPLTQIYNTQLDSRRIQVEDLVVANGDDYRYNRKKLKNCVLATSIQEYWSNCPVHVDDWSACEYLTEAPEKDLEKCGLPLTTDHLYTKFISQRNAANAGTSVMVFVTQKRLVSGPLGVDVF